MASTDIEGRRRRLVNALSNRCEIQGTDARAWTLEPAGSDSPAKYRYTHPRVPGVHYSLRCAKQAHLAWRALRTPQTGNTRSEMVHKLPVPTPAPAAAVNSERFSWGPTVPGVAIAPEALAKREVLYVDRSQFKDVVIDDKDWNKDDLVRKHGFTCVTRSTVVVDKYTHEVLVDFATGDTHPELVDVSKRLPDVHSLMRNMNELRHDRDGLFMFGVRHSNQATIKNPKTMPTGYYTAKTLRAALELREDPRLREALVPAATGLCALERAISPAMGANRSRHAALTGHPGMVPGMVDVAACPVAACAISHGLTNKVHVDKSRFMSETICWYKGHCFSVVDAGVVFDLSVHDATMVMVLGSLRHGTPNERAGVEANGYGFAIVNKDNLAEGKAIRELATLRELLACSPEANPYVQSFATPPDYDYACKHCSSTDGGKIYLCDLCSEGFHVACDTPGVKKTAKDVAFCSGCTVIVATRARRVRDAKRARTAA
jgi:hypothetical protein